MKSKNIILEMIIYYELFTMSLVSGVRNKREREREFSQYIVYIYFGLSTLHHEIQKITNLS